MNIIGYGVSLAWLIALIWGSLLPLKELPNISLFRFDKLIHFFMYFGLVALFLWTHQKHFILTWKLKIGVCLFAVLLGAGIEYIQGAYITGRSFDIYDIWANNLGVILALLLIPKRS